MERTNRRRRKQLKTTHPPPPPPPPAATTSSYSEEVSSMEWEFINMTEQEEDLIYRMYKLVGDKWALIAGRLPGRNPEEIERFWIMRHGDGFAGRRRERNNKMMMMMMQRYTNL